jgi:hypothetical protein
MHANRPLIMSLPLGLFSNATISGPLPKIPKKDTTLFPLDRALLDMPAIATDGESDTLTDDLYWKDEEKF